MIDVAQYKAEIAAIPGNSLIIPRAQIDELLNELETGQIAKRTLCRIVSVAGRPQITRLAPLALRFARTSSRA